MRRKLKQPPQPPPPAIEEAMRQVQRNADESMLGQMPYADYLPGFGWIIDSVCGGPFPSNAKHVYHVSVLPTEYFRGVEQCVS